MPRHYTRKTKLRNSELLRDARVILDQTADNISILLEKARASHKKPNTKHWLFWCMLRSAQFVGKCMKPVSKEDAAMIDAIDKYCGPYE